jgi:hypothetical protein
MDIETIVEKKSAIIKEKKELSMQSFLKKATDWILEKEELLAKACAIPLSEIDAQLQQVQKQKARLKKNYEESMEVLDAIEAKLQKIRSTEVLRCQNKEV